MKKLLFALLLSFISLGTQAQNLSDALYAIEAEKYERAGEILKNLVANNPDDGRYNFHLGNLYLILQEPALARAAFEQGLAAKKNSQINHVGLGRLLLDDGKIAEAEAEFNLATQKLRKKDTEEYLYIAIAYLNSFNSDYERAREFAQKVVEIDPSSARGFITLGDAQYKLENLNEAYMAYRSAFELDKTMYRAKLNMARITKNARAFPEAAQALEEITQLDPSYGPSYRELAEVYYLWAVAVPNSYSEYIAKALKYYEQYMELTDYSLDSRMRHADFLVLAKDYASLEKEAMEMQKIDNVNPRILRYLGYSAYENKNYQAAADALTKFMNSVDPRRILGVDYTYLAKAEFKLLMQDDPIEDGKMDVMLENLRKAIELEAPSFTDFSAFAKELYDLKNYYQAAQIYQVLTTAPDPELLDLMYFGNAALYAIGAIDENLRPDYLPLLVDAEAAYEAVIVAAPSTFDAYYNAARLNYLIAGREEQAVEWFERYLKALIDAGEEVTSRPANISKMSITYSILGSIFFDTDKQKAKDFFRKSLELNPNNEQAQMGLEYLEAEN